MALYRHGSPRRALASCRSRFASVGNSSAFLMRQGSFHWIVGTQASRRRESVEHPWRTSGLWSAKKASGDDSHAVRISGARLRIDDFRSQATYGGDGNRIDLAYASMRLRTAPTRRRSVLLWSRGISRTRALSTGNAHMWSGGSEKLARRWAGEAQMYTTESPNHWCRWSWQVV